MDAKRQKSKNIAPWVLRLTSVCGLIAVSLWLFGRDTSATRTIDRSAVIIREVISDTFYEYINLNGQVRPRNRQILDCRMAGTVEEVYVESGDVVRRGDTLLRLSNATLELEVMQRESELIEQLNGQRQTALLLNQNDFNRRAEIIENDYQFALESKRFKRADTLLSGGVIALADYEPTQARLDYFTAQKQLLRDAYQQDSLARSVQLRQITDSEKRLLNNLSAIRELLNRLWIIAPTNGKLDQFSVVAGQSISPGQRLGELYELTAPYLEAEVDEYYLNQVALGQTGVITHRSNTLIVRVEKISPSIENGRFGIQLGFAPGSDLPTDFINGQTLRFRLRFGDARQSILLPSGDFFSNTGGSWVYVVQNGIASRREVELGRRNPAYYEVIAGLQPGEKVITSNYDLFKDQQKIILTE